MRRSVLLLGLLLATAVAPAARAQDAAPPEPTSEAKVAAFNVVLTGTFAVARSWIEGRLEAREDALRVFLYGAAGGYGFYHAKRLAGGDRLAAGMGLAYLSASVVENAAQGRHPLGYVRLGLGPADLRLRTPLARSGRSGDGARATVEVNAAGLAGLVVLPLLGYRPVLRGGLLHYRSPEPLGREGDYQRRGLALGRVALLGPQAPRGVLRHEAVHVIQALQVGAVTPYYRLRTLWPAALHQPAGAAFRGDVRWDVQIDWLYGALMASSLLLDYSERWAEVEAYTLTQEPERER